jgi:hypothetical protein
MRPQGMAATVETPTSSGHEDIREQACRRGGSNAWPVGVLHLCTCPAWSLELYASENWLVTTVVSCMDGHFEVSAAIFGGW